MKPRRDANWLRKNGGGGSKHDRTAGGFFADRERQHILMQPQPVPVDPTAQCELALQRGAAAQQPYRAAKHDKWISPPEAKTALLPFIYRPSAPDR